METKGKRAKIQIHKGPRKNKENDLLQGKEQIHRIRLKASKVSEAI